MEPPGSTPPERTDRNRQVTLIVYVLYLLAPLTGLTAVIAIIVNHLKREEVAGNWLASHFTWQIRTFWWTLGGTVVGGVLMIVGVGALILMAVGLWYLYRNVKGLLRLFDDRPIENPLGWF